MNDEELKKKLSVLKSASVPKGYWDTYGSRLQQRLAVAEKPVAEEKKIHVPWVMANNWFAPAIAAFFMGVAGYRLGSNAFTSTHIVSPMPIQLASATSETQAQQVFRQMLDLFPKRVNWISFQDGKVDFSISSAAYPDSKTLIPLILTLPRPDNSFEARILIRPGQSARVEGSWDKQTEVTMHVQVTPDGKKAVVSCRLNGSGLDTEVEISQEGTQPLGSFRVGERLVQAQLTRLRQGSGGQARVKK